MVRRALGPSQTGLIALHLLFGPPFALRPNTATGQPGRDLMLTTASCPSCTIVRRSVARFGTDAASQDLAPSGLAGAIPAGESGLVGVPIAGGGGPVVFGIPGTASRRLGRLGQGPGEFRAAGTPIPWRGDSIVVFDASNRRLSVYTPGLRFVRSIGFPVASLESIVTLANGNFVVNAGSVDSRESLGYPIHVCDEAGRRLRSFGVTVPVVRPDQVFELVRLLATDGRRVWTAIPQGRYRLEEWDPHTGKLVRGLRRRAAFYPESVRDGPITPTNPPPAGIVGLYYDRGLLWVFVKVPGPNWAAGLSREPSVVEGGGRVYQPQSLDTMFDTIVEAFDAESGHLLASKRFPQYLTVLLSQGRMAVHQAEDEAGGTVSEFFAFDLRGR